MAPIPVRIIGSLYIFTWTINDESRPIVFKHQESAIRLRKILYAELDKCLILYVNAIDQLLDDPVFTPLRKNLELIVLDVFWLFRTVQFSQYHTLIDFNLANRDFNIE